MKRIVLATSSSGLDNLNYEHDIGIVRLHLQVNGNDHIDGKNLNNNSLREYIIKNPDAEINVTPATRGEVANLFTRLHQEGFDEVLITCLSSKINDSFKIIKQVSYAFREKMKFYVYDCRGINTCEAMIALEADRLLKEGEDLKSIVKKLDAIRDGHKMMYFVNDENHYGNHHKSPTIGYFANKLKITPVLSMGDDGGIIEISKTRSVDKTLNYIIDSFASLVDNNKCYPYIISSSDNDVTNFFVNLVKDRLNIDAPVFPVSNVTLVSHGVNTIGLCAFSSTLPHILKR